MNLTLYCDVLLYCTTGAEALQNAAFGGGSFSQLILLDDLRCTGTETRLVDCDHNGINIHNCFHGEDASVRCMLPPGMAIHCKLENQMECFVLYAVPGFPANVEIKPSKTDCSEVTITWDYPKDYMYPSKTYPPSPAFPFTPSPFRPLSLHSLIPFHPSPFTP